VLTGRETIATAFAETAHRHRDSAAWNAVRWGDLAVRVRNLTLGMAGTNPSDRVSLAGHAGVDRWVVGLSAACLGAALDEKGTPVEDIDGLAVRGADIDRAEPDRFEALRAAVSADGAAFVEGDVTYTGANLLWAAASLSSAMGAGAADRLLTTLDPETAAGWVVGVLVPVVTAAALVDGAERAPTLLVCADRDAATLAEGPQGPPAGRRWRRATTAPAPPVGLEDLRAALVVDAGPGARRLAARGVPVRPATAFEGHAGLVTGDGGRPLPGVTVGIADDGEIVVRSEAVAPERAREGWLHTGRRGELDAGGRLTVAPG
jgi:hypothetical protein